MMRYIFHYYFHAHSHSFTVLSASAITIHLSHFFIDLNSKEFLVSHHHLENYFCKFLLME